MYLRHIVLVILFVVSQFCHYETTWGVASDEKGTSRSSEKESAKKSPKSPKKKGVPDTGKKRADMKSPPAPYREGQILIKFKKGSSPAALTSILPGAAVEVVDHFPEIGVYCLDIKGAGTVPQMIEKLKDSPLIEYAEPNYLVFPTEKRLNNSHSPDTVNSDGSDESVPKEQKGERNADKGS